MSDGLFDMGESFIDIPHIKTPKIGFHQLVVLGNGFDLECGLPTRFCHFFEPRIEALETQDWETPASSTVWDTRQRQPYGFLAADEDIRALVLRGKAPYMPWAAVAC